ncbi:MAG TPA: adenylate/guanylate cyclase domain-containing protein [Streptosporangiaceae bacterium]|jgi:predicted ATPase/class 3 adenylate cyclase
MTFLFTDIAGSTMLLRRTGEATYGQVLAAHHALIRSALAAYGGTELTMMGDGFFAAFTSPRDCVAAVLSMQQGIEVHAWPAGQQVRVRMGVHTGEAETTSAGPVGLDVHRAARIAAVAHGGQVLLSETSAALVRDALPDGVGLADLGVHRLKDLGRPERLFQLTAPALLADFPPLRSLGNPALLNNLPAELSTFVGREHELKEVQALAETGRLVTLVAAGGAGKTRLAMQAAAELLDDTDDGVWLVELAAVTDAEAVPASIAAALGIVMQPGRPALDTLADALAPQRALIVLDNCEHLIDACAKTADAILRRCSRMHLLATSREPLGIDGEVIYWVPSLSLPADDDLASMPEASDAVALFIDRARQHGVELALGAPTGPLIASICRRLDGMPLAIELAAARLHALSVGDLRDRLDQRFRLLTGGSRAALARQQTLLATVDWSHSLLTTAEQRLLRRLAVFTEGFDLAAAEATCSFGGIDRLDVVDLLGSLVNKSLVLTEQSPASLRYRLLETIRQFAAERLADAGEGETATAAAAHSAHFLSVAEQAGAQLHGPEQGRWFTRLDADQGNLWRAAEYAVGADGGTSQALRFGAALRTYWTSRRAGADVASLFAPVLARPEARSDLTLYARAALTVMDGQSFTAGLGALQLGEDVLHVARQVGDRRLLIEALGQLCGMHYFAGEPEQGIPYGVQAVELARRLGDDALLAGSIMEYLLCLDVTNPADASPLYREGIACAQRCGDRKLAHVLHNNASVHAIRAGDFAGARAHLLQAVETGADIGQANDAVPINLGWVLRHEQDTEGARATFETGLRKGRRIGDRYHMAYCILGLACTVGDQGDWQQAAELHGVAQAFADRLGAPWQDPEELYRRESIERIRARLRAAEFDATYHRGMGLSFDDALTLALGPVRQAAA